MTISSKTFDKPLVNVDFTKSVKQTIFNRLQTKVIFEMPPRQVIFGDNLKVTTTNV